MLIIQKKKEVHDVDTLEYFMGVGLLGLSLLCDGFTGPLQEYIFNRSKPSPVKMMKLNNFYATIICALGGFVFTSQGMDAINFCQKYPEVWGNLITISVLAALGQLCIFLLISNFGALVCSITTTTRKFFTILVSVIFYHHHMASRQWIGVALVFAGLFLNVTSRYMHQPKTEKKEL